MNSRYQILVWVVVVQFAIPYAVSAGGPEPRSIDSQSVVASFLLPPPDPQPTTYAVPAHHQNLALHLRGEFESQSAILISGHGFFNDEKLYSRIVDGITQSGTPVLIMVNDQNDQQQLNDIIQHVVVRKDYVYFINLPHNTIWVRDYGPMVISGRLTGTSLVDACYDISRMADDHVPSLLGVAMSQAVAPCPLQLEGGNLLSNGQGLLITTHRLHAANSEMELVDLQKTLCSSFGAKRVLMLEPMLDESTGHVDMFAAFTAPDCVVVGSCDAEVYPENAALLNRNASRLARVRFKSGRGMRVVRLPMYLGNDGNWRSYTNVVFANGVLLVPVYRDARSELESHVLQTYRTLLPNWSVIPISADSIIEDGGALHCITMNLNTLEVAQHLRPIGRDDAERNWSGSSLRSISTLRFRSEIRRR